MKPSTMKKSLLDYAIRGQLSARFREENPKLDALSEISAFNEQTKAAQKQLAKRLKTLESSLKTAKDSTLKRDLKTQIASVKKESQRLKIITPLDFAAMGRGLDSSNALDSLVAVDSSVASLPQYGDTLRIDSSGCRPQNDEPRKCHSDSLFRHSKPLFRHSEALAEESKA